MIRRSRKRKDHSRPPTRSRETRASTECSDSRQLHHLTSDDGENTAHERLQRLVGKDHHSLRALGSLLEEYAVAWQGSSAFDRLAEGAVVDFFPFEDDQVRAWVDGE